MKLGDMQDGEGSREGKATRLTSPLYPRYTHCIPSFASFSSLESGFRLFRGQISVDYDSTYLKLHKYSFTKFEEERSFQDNLSKYISTFIYKIEKKVSNPRIFFFLLS